jgi:transcriptional regulator with XRE-family HTH domain
MGAGLNWGGAVFQARVWAELSKRALAKSIDVDPSYITHIEAGRKTPSLGMLEDIAVACGVSVVEMAEIAESTTETHTVRRARQYLATYVGLLSPIRWSLTFKGEDRVKAVCAVLNDAVQRGERLP